MDKPIQTSALTEQNRIKVNNLYSQYAAMLLGYIFEVVKNHQLAEQYLIAVFNEAAYCFDESTKTGLSIFTQLKLIARKKMVSFLTLVQEHSRGTKSQGIDISNNKYISLMSTDQQYVFCGMYWHGKSVGVLAAEIKKPEIVIRKIITECFIIIRNTEI